MRCKQCDYALWNLRARQCPECGAAFAPSSYRFVPNAVRFMCPHCGQAYYGTAEHGHLEPPEFECVCGRRVHMDEMVLLPAEGVAEYATMSDTVPWLERGQKGFFSAWLRTIWAALITPHRVVTEGNPPGSTGQAWWFAIVTLVVTALLAFSPFLLIMLVFVAFGGGAGAFGFFSTFGVLHLIALVISLILLAVWGLVTHALLRLTGPTAFTLGRTYQALCYSSGANIASGVPCFGSYFGWIWWVVSAVIMTCTAQRVSGARASFAVLALPVASIILVIALYVGLFIWISRTMGPMITQAGMMLATDAPTTSRAMASGLILSHSEGGNWPAHALTLANEHRCTPQQFIVDGSLTRAESVRLGGTSLAEFGFLTYPQQIAAAVQAAEDLPDDAVAYRVGDHVFTYRGVPPPSGVQGGSEQDLWLVIVWLDPDWNETGDVDGSIWVGMNALHRRSRSIPIDIFDEALTEQNALRRSLSLPPLPHPREVRHGKEDAEAENER